jgi:hypothetical protein
MKEVMKALSLMYKWTQKLEIWEVLLEGNIETGQWDERIFIRTATGFYLTTLRQVGLAEPTDAGYKVTKTA